MDDSQKRTQARVRRVREALDGIAARTLTARQEAVKQRGDVYRNPDDATLTEAEAFIRKQGK